MNDPLTYRRPRVPLAADHGHGQVPVLRGHARRRRRLRLRARDRRRPPHRPGRRSGEAITDWLPEGVGLLPNTAGCQTAEEAVRVARLARAGGLPDWIKLEVIPDPRYLLPDGEETLQRRGAARRRGLHGPAVRPAGSRPAAQARGGRLRDRDAARRADRLRPRAQAAARDRDHGRAGRGARDRRRRARRAVAGGRVHGAGRRRRAREHGDRARRTTRSRWRARLRSASRRAAPRTSPG